MTDESATAKGAGAKDGEPTGGADAAPASLDRGVRVTLFAVVAFGAVACIAALALSGVQMAFSVGVGAAAAASNLYLLARIVKSATTGKGLGIWGVLGLVKTALLLLGVWMLLKMSVIDPIGLVIGFGCLPLGIFIGGALRNKER
jgi:hypothetical protein